MGQAPRIALLLGVVLQSRAMAADHPREARVLALKQDAGTGKATLNWTAKLPPLLLPAVSPLTVGGTLRVVGRDQDVALDLPASGWSTNTGVTMYKYQNPLAPGGASPVKIAVLKSGSGLKVRARGTGIDLDDAAQGSLSVVLTIGDDVYCSICTTPSVDRPGRYLAKRCPAPAACATTATTTTTTTTLSGPPTSSTTTSTLCSLLRDWGGFGDGPGQFDNLYGVAATADGQRVYTVELTNRVQEFDADGAFIAQWGSTGTGDGKFQNPVDVGAGPGGDVYVVDQANQRIQRFDGDGAFLGTWGMAGSADGAFTNPNGIGIDADGNVYVADSGNDRVQKFDRGGMFLGAWTTSVGAPLAPVDVALDGTQYAYVTFVGGGYVARYQTDGTPVDVPITSVPFRSPVAVDGLGRIYFGNPVLRRWDSASGGEGVVAWSGAASITGIVTAPGNVVYVSDYGNSRVAKLSCPP